MNKKQFLEKMSSYLRGIPAEDEKDIISDFKEHFEIGIQEGRTEEELAESLGDPKSLANQLRASLMVEQAEKNTSAANIVRAVFASLGLGFFNLIFVLGPFLVIAGVMVALFAAALGVTSAGITGFFGSFFGPLFPQYFSILVNPAVSIFISIGVICLGVLFFIGDIFLAKWLYRLFVMYIKFNARIITGRGQVK
ncbi:MAG: DUF1700 domain-containing protein [Actinobacteria bacterium]|nr:DUF1700 domain-containing protein [Actinomycetota bacterium]